MIASAILGAILEAWQQAPVTFVLAVTGIVPLVYFARWRKPAFSSIGFEPPEIGLAFAVGFFVAYAAVGLAIFHGAALIRGLGFLTAAIVAVGGLSLLSRHERPRGTRSWRLLAGLVGLWAALPVIYGIATVIAIIRPDLPVQAAVETIHSRDTGWIRIVFTAVLVAPVFEELVFRGFLQASLRQFWTPHAACVVSALAFALIHEHAAKAPMFAFGYAIGMVRDRTGSVVPCIVGHIAFNALTIGQLLVLSPS